MQPCFKTSTGDKQKTKNTTKGLLVTVTTMEKGTKEAKLGQDHISPAVVLIWGDCDAPGTPDHSVLLSVPIYVF